MWYKSCDLYNPSKGECKLSLLKLYSSNQMLQPSYALVDKLITTEIDTQDGYINYFKLWDCDIPSAIIGILLNKLNIQHSEAKRFDAKYILLLVCCYLSYYFAYYFLYIFTCLFQIFVCRNFLLNQKLLCAD